LATSAAALSGWSGHSVAQNPTEAQLERQAPAMPELGTRLRMPRIDLLNGQSFDPAQTAGQPLLIYWWSSTCPFCALQSPSMQALWREHQAKGLRMVALSIDRQAEDARAYLAKRGYTFPAAWASPAWRQAFPKPKGLPITLLVGRDGRLVLAEKGQMFAEDVQAIAQWLV
jgi:peroxiredoxin